MSDRLVHQLLCDVVDVAENIVSAIKVMEEPFDVRVVCVELENLRVEMVYK